MRKLIILGVLFLTGCGGNVIGPFQYRDPQRVDDPRVSIPEQQRRARDRLALPDEANHLAPEYGCVPTAGALRKYSSRSAGGSAPMKT